LKELFENSKSLSFDIATNEDNDDKYPYRSNNQGYEPHNRYINIDKLLSILPNDIIINNCINDNTIKKSNIRELYNNLQNNNNILNKIFNKNDTCKLEKNINKHYKYTVYNHNEKNIAHIKINKDNKDNEKNILIVFNKEFSDNIIKTRISKYDDDYYKYADELNPPHPFNEY
jgi:hypothetical protein